MRGNAPFFVGLLFLASLPLAGCSGTSISLPRKDLKASDEKMTVEHNLQIKGQIEENQGGADRQAKIDRATDVLNLPPSASRFRVKPYLRDAALLQSMGKEKACKRLAELAENGGNTRKVEILCRMLFSKKPGGSLKPPSFGAPVCLGDTNADDWPLLPIEIVDAIPFLIVDGYLRHRVSISSTAFRTAIGHQRNMSQ
jgi:hypothetical protein